MLNFIFAHLGIKVDAANSRTYKADTKNKPLSIVWAGRVEEDQKRADLIPHIAHELEIKEISYRWTVLGDGKDLVSCYQNDYRTWVLTTNLDLWDRYHDSMF